MADDSTAELYFPSLVGGVRSTAPPRTLGPGGQYIYRDSLNMQARDGVMIGRPGIASASSPTLTLPSITGVDTTETPRFLTVAIVGVPVSVLVTDRQAWVYRGSWTNITPTYTTGTVSATNGNNALTFAGGTALVDRDIDSAYITIDGAQYLLTRTGNTTATIQPNFAGATGAGKAFTIHRRFGGAGFGIANNAGSEIFATIYNENLYIAGTRIAKGTGTAAPAVIKVANVYSGSPTTTYLTGAAEYDLGIDFISGLTRIVGISALQDGRIVFTGNQHEVFYSSHLNDAVWTVAPAGSTPLADVDNQLTGQGRIGAALTFHHSTGIVMGDPTGLADPPLRFQATPAIAGAIAPLTLRPYLGGEVFLAADGDVKLFDGSRTVSLGDYEILARNFALSFKFEDACRYHAGIAPSRNEYTLFRVTDAGATKFWTYQPDLNTWWPNEASPEIGVMRESEANFVGIQAVVGINSDSGAHMIEAYREGQTDIVGTPTYMLETDDLDAGLPVVDKTPLRAAVWPVATMTNLVVSARRADDTTYINATASPASTNRPKCFDFIPGQVSGAIEGDNAHRWKLSGTTLRLGVFALLLRWSVNGKKEQRTTG